MSQVSKYRKIAICHPDRKHHARGLCWACYLQAKRSGVLGSFEKLGHAHPSPIKAHCHPERCHVALGLCESCYKKAKYVYKVRTRKIPLCHPERQSGGNGLCRSCYLKEYQLKSKYGISLTQYQELIRKQQNLCAICHKTETQIKSGKLRPLSIDHNANTGNVRELLCMRCNVILGHIEDRITLQRSLEYLAKHGDMVASCLKEQFDKI